MLFVEDLSFSFEDRKILSRFSLEIQRGEIVSLIGTSGSGKTTLFRLLTGLISPDTGRILIENRALPEAADQITYMQQEDLLLSWRTVLSNLLLFSELGVKKKSPDLEEKARILLKRVGLEGYEEYYPRALSGGMRQRVALARALLQNRPLFLLDEPFGSLDVIIREELYHLLREIRDQFHKTLLLVTHDFRDALALSDRIFVLSHGTIAGEFTITPQARFDPRYITEEIRSILTGAAV